MQTRSSLTWVTLTGGFLCGWLSLSVGLLQADDSQVDDLPSVARPSRKPAPAQSPAAMLFEQAMAADAAGDLDLRQQLLQETLQAEPELELARWFSGQVKFQGNWRPFEYVANRVAHDPRWKDYRELLAASDSTLGAHVELARWCRREGLQREEKLHWQQVLQRAPEHRAALGRLGVVRYGGGFYTPAEIKDFEQRHARQQQATKRYGRAFKRLLSQARRGSETLQLEVMTRLAEIDDPLVVEALGDIFVEANEKVSESSNSAVKSVDERFCLAVVSALANIEQHPATLSLLNIALNATTVDLRQSAAESLRGRETTSYMPMLMANLNAPLDTTYSINVTSAGHVSLVQDVEQERPQAVVREVYSNDFSTHRVFIDTRPGAERNGSRIRVSKTPVKDYKNALNVLESRLDMVARHNRARAESNARIIELLKVATAKNLGDHPRAWWEDWHLYNELGDYQTAYQEDYYRDEYTPDIIEAFDPIRRHSCFAAGTIVWTQLGTVAIEAIRTGDRVLSQDPATGRLEYQPVLDTTTSSSMPVRKLVFGDETITTTLGHRFWVAGEGWQMAKFLEPGQRLFSMQGSLGLLATAAAEKTEVYNLVVGEYHTYFVGTSRLLVHDINCPQPTAMALPGVAQSNRRTLVE